MSYILEALKKSEQERTRGVAPTLQAIHAEPFFQRARFSSWHYGVIFAVLAASVLVFWHRPSPMGKSEAKSSDLSSPVMEASPPLRSAPPPALTMAANPPSAEARPEPPAPAKPARRSEKPHGADVPPVAANLAKPPRPEAVPVQEAPAPTPQEDAVRAHSRQDAIDVSELPAAVQRGMPKLAISGYVNNPDDPAGRMVGIGDQLVREGDEVAPGLKLEKIAGTAAVFAYKGYHFRVRLP